MKFKKLQLLQLLLNIRFKPEGLQDDQKEVIKATLDNLKKQIDEMHVDFTYRQYTTFINSILYPKKEKKEDTCEEEKENEKLNSEEELELQF